MPRTEHTTNPAQEAATHYRARGWHLVRLQPGSKAAIEDDWPNRCPEPGDFLPGENIGILTGEPSGGLADVDIDDEQSAGTVRAWLPTTGAMFGRASKPDSHLLYKATGALPKSMKFTDVDGTVLGELRLTGLQTAVPPSIHPSGEPIRWSNDGEPAEIAATTLVETVGWAFAAALLVGHWGEWSGQHHDLTLYLAGAMLKAGNEQEQVERFVELVCTHGGDDPLEILNDRLRAVADSAAKMAAGDAENVGGLSNLTEILGRKVTRRLRDWCRLKEETKPDAETTDYGNGRRLVEQHGADLLYVPRGEGWHVWDGARYAPDDTGRVEQMAKATALTLFEEHKRLATKDANRARLMARHAQRSLNVAGIDAMLKSASTEPEIVAAISDLNPDPFALNVQNGTVNLRTGGIEPHDRESLHTKVCPVTFDRLATCPIWEAFILRAMGGDAEKVAYLQRVIGYALTGDTREQAIFILLGSGGNGKTTLVELLMWLLGGYALKIPTETLMAKRGGSTIPNDIAQLPGIRFVAANETSQGRRLNEALVKDLSGGDTITARFMRREWFHFKPTHKTFAYGNYRPVITGTDDGIWRRIRLIDFGPRIPEEERQKGFELVLRTEGPGILAWAVEGCLRWLTDGLNEPQSVIDATAEYRAEMDVIAGFIEACCETHAKYKEKGADLYSAYQGWCADNGEEPMTSTAFGNELHRHSFEKWKANSAIWRRGVKLTKEGRNFMKFQVLMDDGQANPFAESSPA